MPEIAPLRQVSPGYAPKGGHSSPGLKTWGFLASFIKIRIIIPLRTNIYNSLQLNEALQFKAPDTEIDIVNLDADPKNPESIFEAVLDEHLLVKEAIQAEKEGIDGVFISCFGEPAVDASRGLLKIPVVGGFQPAALIASSVSCRWSIITVRKECIPAIWFLARRLSIAACIASIYAIDIPLESHHDEKILEERLLIEIEKAVDKDGAEAIVLGCTGFLDVSKKLAQKMAEKQKPVPVVNPTASAIGYLEQLIRSGISHSPLTYKIFGLSVRMGT
jgi:allantoin racemase